jgi:hypothetical protein
VWERQLEELASEYRIRNANSAKEAAAKVEAAQQWSMANAQRQGIVQQATSHGYKLIPSVTDLVLDGKQLAAAHAKMQVTGVYKKVGDAEKLFESSLDADQGTDKSIPILTEDAQRSLREDLLSYRCTIGCQISVGGHMQLCHYLAAQFTNYPPMPCLHVEVEVQ